MLSLLRFLAIVPLFCGIAWLIEQHHHGGMKGTALLLQNVIACVLVSFVAALICKQFWLLIAASFVAGVYGARISGPYGGVLGLLVGSFVVLLSFGYRSRSQTKIVAESEARGVS